MSRKNIYAPSPIQPPQYSNFPKQSLSETEKLSLNSSHFSFFEKFCVFLKGLSL